jgi:hypothetical protein
LQVSDDVWPDLLRQSLWTRLKRGEIPDRIGRRKRCRHVAAIITTSGIVGVRAQLL